MMPETLTSYAIGMTALATLAIVRVWIERTRQHHCRRAAAGEPDARAALGCLGCPCPPDAGEEEL
ncbi:MAG: hypothetical protein QF681_12490 [Vicinamibacterales bacterium]|jgi:hypothetical protein|nr:hypothetical protein [Vicinamibacterales bacterium]